MDHSLAHKSTQYDRPRPHSILLFIYAVQSGHHDATQSTSRRTQGLVSWRRGGREWPNEKGGGGRADDADATTVAMTMRMSRRQ